jgi:hypothetical protein
MENRKAGTPTMTIKTSRTINLRLLAVLICAAVLGTASWAGAGIVRDDPTGFLRDREPAYPVKAFSSGVSRELICAEACVVSGRIVLSADQAHRLGLSNARSHDWVEVGRFENLQLDALSWRKVTVALHRRARRALSRSAVEPNLYGQAIAVSLRSGRYGRAGWAQRRP